MSLTADDVREILRLLEASEFDELVLETEQFKLAVRRSGAGGGSGEPLFAGRTAPPPALANGRAPAGASAPQPAAAAPPRALEAPGPAASAGGAGAAGASAPAAARSPDAPGAAPGVVDVPAPLLGIFYRAPKPGAPPYVEVGARVEPDTIIGIIEVMKLMNTVRAGVAGEVVEIPAENAVMVEYEETLIRVRVD